MNQFKLRRRTDNTIPIVGFALSLFGLVMILSSSQILAADQYGGSYYFFIRQLVAWLLGAGAFFYFLRVPIDQLFENRSRLLWVTVIALVLVFLPIIGPKIAGVHRWINLGFFQFQSAELAKLFMVIFWGGFFATRTAQMEEPRHVLIPFILILGLIAGLVMLEPDLGTTFIILLVSMVMFFAARANLIQFIALCFAGVILLIGLIFAAPYRAERLGAFLGKVTNTADNLDEAYHTHQALIAVGSGGLWGVGFGQGTSKYSYLPQAHTDSIFAVIAEELGFFRTGLLLLAYLYLTWRGFLIARRANSRFVQLLAVGISTMFIAQALVNIAGILSVLPLTGVPLPFVSYGGSSLIISLSALGLLTNISRETVDG
jgi:cell division protein FtsW